MLMTDEELRDYLKRAVMNWRQTRDSSAKRAQFRVTREECDAYVDAYQSVHVSAFGEKVP